jgi:eukaryotic-like serine/threonine-protein kinase
MDFIVDLLFNNPYVPWLLVAVAGLVVYQKFSHKVSVRVPGSGMTRDDVMSKMLGSRWSEGKLERQVAKEKKAGNFLAAGKILEDMDRMPQAAEVYLEGQEFWAAASTFEKMGKAERAAELFLQAGDYKKAAALLVQAGKPGKAAVLFQEKGNNLEAARLFGLAGNWDKAADLYSKSGYPLRAAEAYEKQGAFIKAAEAYEKHFTENVTYSTTYSSTAATGETKSALLAGRLYEKAGDLNRAFQAYNKGSYFKEAAGALGKLGQHAKAAEMFLRAEDHQSAAKAYEAAGDPVKAANLLGEVAYKSDKAAEAAAHFVRGRDFLRAAELYESVGMLAEAAGAYETGESWAAAGNVYVRAGLKGKAAGAYERAGEFETAAKLYEEAGDGRKAIELFGKAGQTFKSGEAAAKAGDHQNAIALLQRVGASDENYRTATELLAQLFITTRMPQLAIERVQKAIGGQPVSAANLDLYYWLAVAQESSGNAAEALSVYKKVQSEDLQFRDVNQRVARIETGAPAPVAPTMAVPSSLPMAAPAASPPATPAAPAASPAARAPRFSRKEEIGRGPLGVVHRAEDLADGRSVALRALPAEALRGDGVLQALVADLKAAAQVSHPNLVKVLGMVEVDGERCLIMELVAGKNFAEALRAGRRMTFQQVHGLGRVLAQTLAVVHGRGLVHGSIQPSNIMVAGGVIKIADLGLGRLAHRVCPDGDYRAPENRFDAAGDLYASAAVLYHLLTGTHHKSQPQGVGLPLPSKLSPGVPEAIDKLLLRSLHPRQELRFATAEELLGELKDMVKIG